MLGLAPLSSTPNVDSIYRYTIDIGLKLLEGDMITYKADVTKYKTYYVEAMSRRDHHN